MSRPIPTQAHGLDGRISRRQLAARALALGAAIALPGLPGRSALAQGLDPAAAIQHYYLCVATYEYEEAYAMLSERFQASHPWQKFLDGYADTAFVTVDTGSVTADADTASVPVTITAWHNDGSIHAYSGTYTLVSVGSAWIIDSARIQETDPGNVAPLMRDRDISFGLGPGEGAAGHHYFTLVATNASESPVVAAGIPHLAIRDARGTTVVESGHMRLDAIAPVTLEPGEAAEAPFEWSNWCGADPDMPLVLAITLPGEDGPVDLQFASDSEAFPAPPCIGDAEPTTFQAGAFAPQRQ